MCRLFAALFLTACAAEVAPHADPGDPRVMPVGAVAALDGSFSEGDGLSYAWAVEPEGATLLDSASPFATLTAAGGGGFSGRRARRGGGCSRCRRFGRGGQRQGRLRRSGAGFGG